MGWKTLKERYQIGHAVQVTEKGFCIGSPYIHDLIVIGLDGKITKPNEGWNADLKRYMEEFKADPARLLDAITAVDIFTASIPVYTYEGGKIIEKYCEELGWPNVTHDGDMMFENTFSTDKLKVAKWAKRNAALGVEWQQKRVEEIKLNLAEMQAMAVASQADLDKLNKDFPDEN